MAKVRKRRRSATEWEALISAQRESGVSQQAFCLQMDVPLSTFQLWKQKLRTGQAPATATPTDASKPSSFVPLFGLAGDDDRAKEQGWEIALDLGDGLRLTLRRIAA